MVIDFFGGKKSSIRYQGVATPTLKRRCWGADADRLFDEKRRRLEEVGVADDADCRGLDHLLAPLYHHPLAHYGPAAAAAAAASLGAVHFHAPVAPPLAPAPVDERAALLHQWLVARSLAQLPALTMHQVS